MRYENHDVGFSFELPDGWRRDERNRVITFYGPNGGFGIRTEVIQLEINGINPIHTDPANREAYLSKHGAVTFRTEIAGERNAVAAVRVGESEISIVRDGVHYQFSHANDAVTQTAIDRIRESAQFPLRGHAVASIRRSADPMIQGVEKAIRSGSPEDARRILADAGAPGIRMGGSTSHGVKGQPQLWNHQSPQKPAPLSLPVEPLLSVAAAHLDLKPAKVSQPKKGRLSQRMRGLKRLLASVWASLCSADDLVEFLWPNGGSVPAAERRLMQLPKDLRLRVLLKGLDHDDELVRQACVQHLRGFIGDSTTAAMMRALSDSSRQVRLEAARYFDLIVLQTATIYGALPFELSPVIDSLSSALSSEQDHSVRKLLQRAVETMQGYRIHQR